ncbi:MAG TPA: phenylalanine--tRNA ligase subunit beta [Thermoanaerobaculia bacterium]|nr:phenylalanine--tRNA ligase subunit beta [Thermoanaerobaculia bacterium]
MRIPLSWLKDFVDLELSPEDLAELLTNAGLEVTAIERVGVAGAELEWARDKVVLARIVSVERHPDADRLVLAEVEHGADATKRVVTGAPNLFDLAGAGDLRDRGLYSPLLLEGGEYLDPHGEGRKTRLKGRELRGVYNDAMLCSPVELGLGEDHDGILVLRAGDLESGAAPGTPLVDLLGDAVLDIDIIPNIARCASVLGVAREVAALTATSWREPDASVVMDGASIAGRVEIESRDPELNPRFVALLIEGVEQRPSPLWMQHRLRLAGQRPINVVVDVSNYVMLEMGQPNHTFDWDFLRARGDRYAPDGPVRIVTRLAEPGETMRTLDGVEHRLHPNNILVTDPEGILSLGGIMGGEESEIRPETTNVLLEAAAWNFINIRHSSRQLGIQTDAAFRFSRGVHPSQALLGAKRAAELLRRLAGGTVARGLVDHYPAPAPEVVVDLDPERVRRLTGIDLDRDAIAELLRRPGFTVDDADGPLRVIAPDHRLDIEGPHDLIEEVCRMFRYERVPETVLSDTLPPQRGNPRLEREERLRDTLVELGVQEVITYRLTTPEAESRARADADDPVDPAGYVRLVNPSTAERSALRRDLLASVLEVAAANTRFQDSVCLFEVGTVFPRAPGSSLPDERLRLAIVMTGARAPEHWESGASGRLDFFDLKGVIEGLGDALHVELGYEPATHPSLRPGRTAALLAGPERSAAGHLGELHPQVTRSYELRVDREQPVLAATIDLEALLPLVPDGFPVAAPPAYPPVHEDLALVVDHATSAGAVRRALLDAGAPLVREVTLFDLYAGEKLGAGHKSLAFHLTYQAPDRTLSDRDVEKLRSRMLRRLEAEHGARLRD